MPDYAGTRSAASPSTEASFSSSATNTSRASIPTASDVAPQQLCHGAQRGSGQLSRHSDVNQHEHQPANDAGASAAIPLAYYTLANIRDWSLEQCPPKSYLSKTSYNRIAKCLRRWQKHGCRNTWMQRLVLMAAPSFTNIVCVSTTKAATVVVWPSTWEMTLQQMHSDY